MAIGAKLASPLVAWTCTALAVGLAVGARTWSDAPAPAPRTAPVTIATPSADVVAVARPTDASTTSPATAIAAAADLAAQSDLAAPIRPPTLPAVPESATGLPTAGTPVAAAAAVPPSAEAAPLRSPPPAADPTDDFASLGWPLRLSIEGRDAVVHLPQPRSANDDRLSATAVVDCSGDGDARVIGVAWLELRVITDHAAGLVRVIDASVDRVRFASAQAPSAEALEQALRAELARRTPVLVLEQVTALAEATRQEDANAALSPLVPRIIVRQQPSVLVAFDGPPRLVTDSASPLLRVVNTPFFVVLDPDSRRWHLATVDAWYEAGDGLGPYHVASRVPDHVLAYARQSGYVQPSGDPAAAPAIVVATEASELVWCAGAPTWAPVPGTGLLRLANSPATVFLDLADRRWYVLLSGRWFAAAGTGGPWAMVPADRLPGDFRRIPADGPGGGALAHVAGTPAADDASDAAELPQTATVERSRVQPPIVIYDGPPVWAPAGPPTVVYAVNTPTPVILVQGRYYTCVDAVWFSAGSAYGGWTLCTSVPYVIYAIPDSCPVHHVRYVRVYDVGPRQVRYGYTAGYLGCHRSRGVVVWGSGYRYQPWTGQSFYVPRTTTWGLAAHYDSGGSWVFGTATACAAPVRTVRVVTASHPIALHDGGWFGAGGCRSEPLRTTSVVVAVAAPPVYARRQDVRIDPRPPVAPAATVRVREPRVMVPPKAPIPATATAASATPVPANGLETRPRPAPPVRTGAPPAIPPVASTPTATAPAGAVPPAGAMPPAGAPAVRVREPRVLVPIKPPVVVPPAPVAPVAVVPPPAPEPVAPRPAPRAPPTRIEPAPAATPSPAPVVEPPPRAREPRVFVPIKPPLAEPATPPPPAATVEPRAQRTWPQRETPAVAPTAPQVEPAGRAREPRTVAAPPVVATPPVEPEVRAREPRAVPGPPVVATPPVMRAEPRPLPPPAVRPEPVPRPAPERRVAPPPTTVPGTVPPEGETAEEAAERDARGRPTKKR